MFALVLAILSNALCINVKDCGNGRNIVHLDAFSVKPDPIQKKQNVTYNVTYTFKQQLTSATCQAVVKKGAIPLFRKTINICENIQCPIDAKTYNQHGSIALPSIVPTGSFNAEIHCNDANKKEIICFSGSVTIK
ncbi:putative ML domain [Monocercomonoides exilis]|uniref:putative ML domain n=1 Tax=Monocercomonoides exilis TaxID=2049356 RepID=UPI00355A974D|nr:putative ML domain [Monocercomonoides exilis]|eukprot:MONOS_16094.1-p1 / transcript=MONOS_16094.1 / gene=MONOS_16094 / organism=Monocercomonoides_exilis_PA203 / gene_product=unspecified product / transcript_product=unspecified product / location=Mono_scaffold01501:3493-3897(-) / protein_length=134 / sequence_SO=supercontig / SO=protein_coding / is_pseudo=false